MFVLWQISYFVVFPPPPRPPRNVDIVRTIALVAWCAALLMLLATGGGAFRPRDVREILDDELARAQRAQAYQNAFWAVMVIGLVAYAAAQFTPIDGRVLAHAIVSGGVLVAVATRAYLNRG
jgi:Na+/H+ antiporter NhaD/arsenite permease-like protein